MCREGIANTGEEAKARQRTLGSRVSRVLDDERLRAGVDVENEAEVAVVDFILVAVDRLHHAVTLPEHKAVGGRAAELGQSARRRVEQRLQPDVQSARPRWAAPHRSHDLMYGKRLKRFRAHLEPIHNEQQEAAG